MENKKLTPITLPLLGEMKVPGDKSISHRSVMFGAISNGTTTIDNFLTGEDCLSTVGIFRAMGISIEQKDTRLLITGKGLYGLSESTEPLDFGNSGTTARLSLGILSGVPLHHVLVGDASLTKRPMDRVITPLREMGANIDGRQNSSRLPLSVRGKKLNPVTYRLPVNSAQVKSAILLAGLYAEGVTTVVEPVATRDHTERMITAFGGSIRRNGQELTIQGQQQLTGTTIEVPGDISSAAFFIVAAILVPNSRLVIKDVGLNPTRTGILDVLKKMNADVSVRVTRNIGDEPVGDITVQSGQLSATEVNGSMIPSLIDEIPIIALLATQAKGTTVIRDAKELRFKETDRIRAVFDVLTTLGATITELDDGLEIKGGTTLTGGKVSSYGDHRIGMMVAVASLIADEEIYLNDPDCINISYPSFFDDLKEIISKDMS